MAVTLGDPQGIGPEIIEKSFFQYQPQCSVIIIGDTRYYGNNNIPVIDNIDEIKGKKEKGIYLYRVLPSENEKKIDPSYLYVREGIRLALENKVHALVTGPVSKEKWLQSGIPFKGHTGLLAHSAGVEDHCMFFWSEDMKVALYTIHIPLKDIFSQIKKEKIIHFVRFVNNRLKESFKKEFHFLVSGLNPHAGEGGIIGQEELETIIPAIDELKSEMNITGPFPPDTIFLQARDIPDSVVISWYHDQGLIAFKLLNINSGVNMTLGLPFIRTSPDHGTAFDIAGKGIADPSSMLQAIKLAEHLLSV